MNAVVFLLILGGFGALVGAAMILVGLKRNDELGRFSFSKFMFERKIAAKSSRAQLIGEGIISLVVGLLVIACACKLHAAF